MKKSFLYITLLCSLLVSGCIKEEELPMPATDSPLVLQVNAESFRTAAANTRTSESELSTSFTEGDHIGIIITHPGGKVEHVVFTYKYYGWVAPNTVYYDSDVSYSAYYPYRNAYNGKTLDEIKDLIEPLADQSDYATGYAFSDLMICEDAKLNNEKKLEINFAHAFSMLRMPCAVPMNIECANNAAEYVCDFKATDIIFEVGGTPCRPWIDADGYARLIVKESNSPVDIKCHYTSALGRKEATVTASNLTAGCYHTYSVPIDDFGKYEDYRIGDFFCKDSKNNWYVLPSEVKFDASQHQCLGIVFYIGRHGSDDISNYTDPLVTDGPTLGDAFHGYVIALTDAGKYEWGSYGTLAGTINSSGDWNGYHNQHILVQKGLGNFPAANACAGYAGMSGRESAPVGSSGWFLPSCGQITYLHPYFKDKSSIIRTSVVEAGGSIMNPSWGVWYWSSSGASEEYAWYVNFENGYTYTGYKDYTECVRAVLAF